MSAAAARLPDLLRRERGALANTAAFIALALLAWLAAGLLDPPHAGLVEAAAVLAVGLGAIKLAGIVLFRLAAPGVGAAAPRIVEDLAVIAACVAWGLARLRLSGVDPASLVTTSALLTGLVAFSMQDTLGNVLGGVLLELDRSVRLGDWVRLDDLSGRVIEIRWRHTTLRTGNGERIVVPNASLIKSRFTVIGNPDREDVRWRRSIGFEVDFDIPASRVVAAAEQALAAAEIAHVLREPKPECVLADIELGQCRYALRYWLDDPGADSGTDGRVRLHLLAALERSGISPSLPKAIAYEVLDNERRQAARMARETEHRVAALRKVDLFTPLSDQEVRRLSRHLVHAPFLAGDVVTRQGAIAHWLYILMQGQADVWAEVPDAPRRHVATLAPPTVFGEMGMLTGEPRRATVVARTDLVCYRVDKPAFEELLHARPALAEAMSAVLAARAGGLAQVLADARDEAGVPHESLLSRIRVFFGLDAGQNPGRRAA